MLPSIHMELTCHKNGFWTIFTETILQILEKICFLSNSAVVHTQPSVQIPGTIGVLKVNAVSTRLRGRIRTPLDWKSLDLMV